MLEAGRNEARPAARGASSSDGGDHEWPLVTLVILAHDRRAELAVTLRHLEQLDYPPDRVEAIVVDNASSDGTAAMLRRDFPEVELIAGTANVGISGWNNGFAEGRGEYFLALDDDCYLVGDALKRAVAQACRWRADLVSFTAVSTVVPGHVFSREYELGLLAFWGCAALISRRAISLLGGFDPGIFVWAHEAEFTMRLLDRGLRHLHMPEIQAQHMTDPRNRLTPFFFQTNTRSLAYIAAKRLQPRHAAIAFANLLTAALIRSLRSMKVRYLSAAFAGAWVGSRERAPVGAAVSALYRHNYVDFVSPLRFVRGATAERVAARHRRFRRERADLYPTHSAWLEV